MFGLDKFSDLLTDWEDYLAPWINDLVPGSAHDAMLLVGVVEIVAGIAGRARARGSAAYSWPPGWPASSSTCSRSGSYYDVALRDFGLLVAALALGLLAHGRTGRASRARR